MSNDYRLNLLSEELDKYKAVVLKLTEENEQLKQRLSNCEKFFDELGELLDIEAGCAYWQQLVLNDIKTIQAENERLKSTCLLLQSSESKQNLEKVNCERENYELRKENEELKKEIKENLHYLACMTEQRNKLKLALEEIKVISDDYNLTVNKRRKQIADKISEVLK